MLLKAQTSKEFIKSIYKARVMFLIHYAEKLNFSVEFCVCDRVNDKEQRSFTLQIPRPFIY